MMLARTPKEKEIEHARRRVHAYLRNCVRECRPLLDEKIPLGVPNMMHPNKGMPAPVYYKSKHRRGEFGEYFLHHTAGVR